MAVIVSFEDEMFTEIRSTKYHKMPEDWDPSGDTYKYSNARGRSQEWYNREDDKAFEFKNPELKREPPAPGEQEGPRGIDLHEHIMEVIDR